MAQHEVLQALRELGGNATPLEVFRRMRGQAEARNLRWLSYGTVCRQLLILRKRGILAQGGARGRYRLPDPPSGPEVVVARPGWCGME